MSVITNFLTHTHTRAQQTTGTHGGTLQPPSCAVKTPSGTKARWGGRSQAIACVLFRRLTLAALVVEGLSPVEHKGNSLPH